MTPLFAATLHGTSVPVVVGGAGRFFAAFDRCWLRCRCKWKRIARVERILVADGRAVGVEAAGHTLRARVPLIHELKFRSTG